MDELPGNSDIFRRRKIRRGMERRQRARTGKYEMLPVEPDTSGNSKTANSTDREPYTWSDGAVVKGIWEDGKLR